ncbi:Dabb family protein [Hoeflea sp. TYP-13]|uniref:Dabb family protein n=1 Tax=Hoeflea sp. TYP-13 TaxID=3230023 RepID=UPI0034C61039
MLKHCVFLSLRSEDELPAIEDAMELLAGLVGKVDGMIDFSWGPNRDFEAKSQAYQCGFVTTFTDREAHLAYEAHPDHVRAGGMLVAACRGGHDGIFVADLEVG